MLRFRKYSYSDPWKLFVPLLIVVLNWPPEECPNSELNWFEINEKLSTASLGTMISDPVTDLLLLSTPSTVKLLSRGRWPPTDGPTPKPIAFAFETPGASIDRFRTPAP